MDRYFLAEFEHVIPSMDGFKYMGSHDWFHYCKITDELYNSPDNPVANLNHVEITEWQATEGKRFYCESRPYRSAYSDIEGLEPDPESLAKGKRKTKVYYTDETRAQVLDLMKKAAVLMIENEYDTRNDRSGEQDLINQLNQITDLQDLNIWREQYLGICMPKDCAVKLGVWDDVHNVRTDQINYQLGF